MENKSFDVRQNLIASYKKVDKNIVIVSVDERSYEYLLEKYGEWPISRNIYADVIKYLEKQNPAVVAFDLMFVKSIKSSNNADLNLAQSITKNDNVYTAINFDDQLSDLRKPADLPNNLKVDLKNESNIDLKKWLSFTNCRTIIPQILNTTSNIGHINLFRDNDGIAREMATFVSYKDDFYPHLALKVAMKYLEKTENLKQENFVIDKNNNMKIGERVIPLNEKGSAILNWYGPSGINSSDTFMYVPIWQLEKDMYENSSFIPKDFFKDKIVYIGTSATSLYDLKSVPTDRIFPGVEIHTTFINNLLNNEFIKKTSIPVDITISLIFGLFIGLVVVKSKSTIVSSTITTLSSIIYIIATIYAMLQWNLWIGIILPLVTVVIVFISCYIAKYIIKSRDLEYTYALATTDGLTDLYNHRYFQEQMQQNIATSKRYNKDFSLIMIDIDYFKKFNDTYGHQSGDAVLRQVAQILKKNVRSSDIVCRYGDEEMAIILTNTGNEEALITAQKICKAVSSQPLKLVNGNNVNVTISLGVATCPLNGDEPAQMIKYADDCLYKAKEHGRNQVGNLAED
jgi:diguanylate cyclase (GGDEF)-like protein